MPWAWGGVTMLLYRFALGGPGVLPAFLSIALILLVTAAVRRHFDSEDLPWPHLALLALVLFSPNGLPILLLPNGRELQMCIRDRHHPGRSD